MICFVMASCAAQTKNAVFSDSAKMYYKERLDAEVDRLIKQNKIDLNENNSLANSILDTEEKAVIFAKSVIKINDPRIEDSLFSNYIVNEDKSTKLWMICFQFSSYGDARVFIIVHKNNCKVVYFSHFIG